MAHSQATVCVLLLRHPRRARRGTSGSSTSPIVGRRKQLVQSYNLARPQVTREDGVGMCASGSISNGDMMCKL